MITLLKAMDDEALFARWFRNRDTWTAWRAYVAALFGLSMDDDALAIYRACTGRTTAPTTPFEESVLICGRRSGKSFVMSLIAVYLGCFRDYRDHLAPGERATIFIIATDRKQARTIVRYIGALLREVPMLARMLERESTESFDLNNRVTIEVGTASYRSIRGYTLAAAVADEIAFWATDDAAEPDYAILDALRPGMATIPGAVLICASSPYARKGALHDAYRRYHGKDDAPVLTWQAGTRTMNPTVPQRVIDQAMERDAASASAEFLARFRDDIEDFVSLDLIERAQREYPPELPYVPGTKFIAHCDPAGGGQDEFTISIAHREKERAVVDLVRGRRGSPAEIVAEYALLLKSYNIRSVTGDRYAGAWPGDEFARHAIKYEIADQDRSGLYLDTLAALNSGRVELPPCEILKRQFVGLERKTSKSGRDTVNHAPSSHDDRANSCAGAISATLKTAVRGRSMVDFL